MGESKRTFGGSDRAGDEHAKALTLAGGVNYRGLGLGEMAHSFAHQLRGRRVESGLGRSVRLVQRFRILSGVVTP
ncbi:MAG TPA: hypothetical protein VLJ38_18320 [Polyangiaceae bacterium]|nr:hypothetical protein [Polyangiaceae bacterium]